MNVAVDAVVRLMIVVSGAGSAPMRTGTPWTKFQGIEFGLWNSKEFQRNSRRNNSFGIFLGSYTLEPLRATSGVWDTSEVVPVVVLEPLRVICGV